MAYTVTPTAIADVLMLDPQVFGDARGYFYESFNQKDFERATGLTCSLCRTTTAARRVACCAACTTRCSTPKASWCG